MRALRAGLIVALLAGSQACGGGNSGTVITPTPVHVAPNYQGAWSGIWVRQQCSETGNLGLCNSFLTTGPLALTITQAGSSIQGSLVLGQLLINVAGPVNSDDSLSLAGQGTALGGTLNLSAWRSSLTSGTMAGTFAISIFPPSPGASLSFNAGLQGVVRK